MEIELSHLDMNVVAEPGWRWRVVRVIYRRMQGAISAKAGDFYIEQLYLDPSHALGL